MIQQSNLGSYIILVVAYFLFSALVFTSGFYEHFQHILFSFSDIFLSMIIGMAIFIIPIFLFIFISSYIMFNDYLYYKKSKRFFKKCKNDDLNISVLEDMFKIIKNQRLILVDKRFITIDGCDYESEPLKDEIKGNEAERTEKSVSIVDIIKHEYFDAKNPETIKRIGLSKRQYNKALRHILIGFWETKVNRYDKGYFDDYLANKQAYGFPSSVTVWANIIDMQDNKLTIEYDGKNYEVNSWISKKQLDNLYIGEKVKVTVHVYRLLDGTVDSLNILDISGLCVDYI